MPNILTNLAVSFKDAVTDVGTVLLYPLGTLREENGKRYRYVTVNDATVAAAAGKVALTVGTTPHNVCCDVSDTDAGLVAGVFVSVIANGGYGWILVEGYYAGVSKMAHAWVKGDAIFAATSSTSDGKAFNWKFIAASTTNTITAARFKLARGFLGNAAAAVSSTTATGGVYVRVGG